MSFANLRPELHTLVGLYVGLGIYAAKRCSKKINAAITAAKTLHSALRLDIIVELANSPFYCYALANTPGYCRVYVATNLHWACRNGYLPVAQWLTEYFKLTPEDARSNDNYALRWACLGRHLPVVRWLVIHFKLTPEDARACNNEALRWACSKGHLPTAQWLVAHFKLGVADVANCTSENPSVAAWLAELRG